MEDEYKPVISGITFMGYSQIRKTVQAFLKKWWVESVLKRQTSCFHYGSKFPAVTITVFITIVEQNR
jgi:hypothetical protein